MSSSSTIYLQNSPNSFHSGYTQVKQKSKDYATPILWGIASIYAASSCTFSNNLTGMTLSIPILDVIFLGIATFMLRKGINKRAVTYMIPWLVLNCSSVYFHHVKELISIHSTLKLNRRVGAMPWCAFIFSFLLLAIRLILIVRMIQLAATIYVRKCVYEAKCNKAKNKNN